MINSSCAEKNLNLFVKLYFGHMFMRVMFGLQWTSRSVDINHPCFAMTSFVIFILDEIVHV